MRAPKKFLSVRHFFWWLGQYYQTPWWRDRSREYRRRHPYCQCWWLHWLTFWWPWKNLHCHHKYYQDSKGYIFFRERDRDLMTMCSVCHYWHHALKRLKSR